MAFSEVLHGGWLQFFVPFWANEAKAADTFKDTLEDAEILLTFAAESGEIVSPDLVESISAAQTGYRNGTADSHMRAAFYDAYARLAKQCGDVTALSIRNCTSGRTRRTLQCNRLAAVLITFLIATVSVATFVADTMSAGIVEDTTAGNGEATKLRAALTPVGGTKMIDPIYVQQDPCTLIDRLPPAKSGTISPNLADIEALQHFAIVLRDLHGRALKLNMLVQRLGLIECDPLGACVDSNHRFPNEAMARAQTQIQPAILNYDAEVLCKIETFQTMRGFAANVRADYIAVMGGIAAYALPIAYAWLGAFAFRLRLFAETIRKRTYHPSFADSARMITAVIAGAIVGLFNPAQGMTLSPLATAFLVGYGVELFFKFLDTLLGAFGSASLRQAK